MPVREPALFTSQMGDEILGRLGRKKEKIFKSASEIPAVPTNSVMYTSAVTCSLFRTAVFNMCVGETVSK